jgi:histidinol-phosphate/aromatic aminotransferase/cobyric acid decarboxylase-like protein/choline kinase
MQAVILAAGMGKRLKDLTQDRTKCMVKVNGISLAERALRILDRKHLSRIVVVVGYKAEDLQRSINELQLATPVVFINNTIYDKTNNIYSLLMAKEYLIQEDTLLLESDLIFEESVIDCLIEDPRPTLALVDKFASWMDGTCMELDDDDVIRDFIPGKYLKFEEKGQYYKTVNIYKFSQNFSAHTYIPFLEAYLQAMGVNEYYESVIKLIALLENSEIRAKRLTGQVWYEIDDVQDLDIASTLFPNSGEERYEAITARYGGYWRYPKLRDYCYLVNPYFPPQKMMDEIKSNFEELVSQYPSGMKVNSLLAAKNFGVKQEHILVGNGAAELIKALLEQFLGKTGVIRPTFEEYGHRCREEIVTFTSSKDDFSYTADDLMAYFSEHSVDQLILINPDNPSGNYIPYRDVLRLIQWAKDRQITLVIDESFADFAKENIDLEKSLIKEEIFDLYDRLYVIKSISKSYGVPGLRLGVLASADAETIEALKKDVAIWNINSFAEFYMQIAEKYKKDYLASLVKIGEAREKFLEQLRQIPYLTAFDSEANYIMCELKDGRESRKIAEALLEENILIKDLTGKIGNGRQYIRLAVRTEEENTQLAEHLNRS